MRSVFLASRWTAAALAIALFAVTGQTRGDNEPHSKNKGSGNGGARSNSGGGGGKPHADGGGNSGGGGKPSTGGRSRGGDGRQSGGEVKRGTGGRVDSGSGGKSGTGGSVKRGTDSGKPDAGNRVRSGGGKSNVDGGGQHGTGNRVRSDHGEKPHGGGDGKINHKGPSKSGWNSWTKNGWNKDGWNNNFNSQHHHHHHGYWNNGIWVAPWVIAYNQPWVYLQPTQPIVSGQKWLGIMFAPYEGGGAYITGIYEGSPAQAVGLEVGDVIVAVDGVDASDLGNVLQASDGNVVLQVLSGRTGELVQTRVNLIR